MRLNYHGLMGADNFMAFVSLALQNKVSLVLAPYAPMAAFEWTVRYLNFVVTRYISGFDGNVIIGKTHKRNRNELSHLQSNNFELYLQAFGNF